MNKLSFIGLLLVLFSQVCQANTYYVSVSGNNLNLGSIALPFKTLQKGADMLTPGDTVFVRGGTYTGELLYINTMATAANPAVFINYPKRSSDHRWGIFEAYG